MKKIILLSILIICIIGNSIVFASESEEKVLSYPEYKIETLLELGILDSYSILEDNEPVSRGQAAHYITSLIALSDIGSSLEGLYTDVNSKTEYSENIMVLSELGIIHGYGDGTFKPNNDISFGEFIKLILSSLGYKLPAESSGGYPAGYIRYAASTNLLSGINSNFEEFVTFGDVVELLYNALDVEIMSVDSYSGEDLNLSSDRGKTVLSQLHHIYKAEGTVNANSLFSLTASQGCEKGQIMIDDYVFEQQDFIMDGMVGHSVEYYYKENSSGDYVIIYARVIDNDRTLTINSDDFDKYTGSSFEYFAGNKEKNARVNKLTNILYNNRPIILDLSFSLSNGSMELIDNDKDGVYDVVFIKEYRNVYASHIDYENGIIYDKYDADNPITVDISSVGESVAIYNRKGESIDFDELKNDSLLCCYISKDKSCIEIYELVNEIIGYVEGTEIRDNVQYVILDGEAYRIAAELSEYGAKWTSGEKIICYLDISGAIASVSDMKTTKYKWAILENISASGGLSPEICLKIFDEDSAEGVLSVYHISSRINIDGDKFEETLLCNQSFEQLISLFGGARGLIKYAKNTDGEITSILTENSDEIILYSDYTTYLSNKTTSILGGKVGYNTSTIIFTIPDTGAGEEIYRVSNAASYISNQSNYHFKVYKTDANKLDADVLIGRSGNSTSVSRSAPVLMVDKVSDSVNKDGNVVKRIYGYRGNTYVSYLCENEKTLNSVTAFGATDKKTYTIKKGDLIAFVTNSKGELRTAVLLCRGTEEKIYSSSNPSTASYNNSQRLIFGNVYKKNGLAFQITTLDDLSLVAEENLELYRIISDTCVYVYDSDDDIVRCGNINDLVDYNTSDTNYSKVAVYADTGKINAILIMK